MYISLKWVRNIIGLENLSLSVLCERLTLAGFEIEETIKKTSIDELDFILDVSLTANRPDLFNLKGFIKELQAIFFKDKDLFAKKDLSFESVNLSKLNSKPSKAKLFVWENFIQKELFYRNKLTNKSLSKLDYCYTFFSIESKVLKVGSSPKWLEKCLISSSILPVNNIVDTINFVNIETGYPFFVCDLNKLKNYLKSSTFSFSTRLAKKNESVKMEGENCVILEPNNLLFFINKKPISILGLLSLKEIEIDNTTENILVYGGLFDPLQIRKSSQSLGIRTEQSTKIEKNLNFNGLEQAFIRLSFLFNVQGIHFINNQLPKIEKIDILNKRPFFNYVENKRPILNLVYNEARNLLGSSIILKTSNILSILKSLNFKLLQENDRGCSLYIPFSRELDLEREVDLIEEIVRISGFTSFISIVPHIEKVGNLSKIEKLKRLLRKYFIEKGLNEVLHYSISNLQSENQVELKNSIVPESRYFRINLLNQLIQKAELNRKQKNNLFEAFEIGRKFSLVNGNIIETELIGGIFGGNIYRSDWNDQGRASNWFEAKGLIEQVFILLNLLIVWKKIPTEDLNILHPVRSANLFVNSKNIGVFGQIHPQLAKSKGLSDQTFMFEINLEILKEYWQVKQISMYKPYSLFPASLIDLAIIKKNDILFSDIQKKIYEIGWPLLETITLFDYYSGSPIPPGYHSLGFKLKFRIFDRTLTNEEVDSILKRITYSLERDFDIKIRK
jgi:phenylalanyl-tRNA synthetase beta chain